MFIKSYVLVVYKFKVLKQATEQVNFVNVIFLNYFDKLRFGLKCY